MIKTFTICGWVIAGACSSVGGGLQAAPSSAAPSSAASLAPADVVVPYGDQAYVALVTGIPVSFWPAERAVAGGWPLLTRGQFAATIRRYIDVRVPIADIPAFDCGTETTIAEKQVALRYLRIEFRTEIGNISCRDEVSRGGCGVGVEARAVKPPRLKINPDYSRGEPAPSPQPQPEPAGPGQ